MKQNLTTIKVFKKTCDEVFSQFMLFLIAGDSKEITRRRVFNLDCACWREGTDGRLTEH